MSSHNDLREAMDLPNEADVVVVGAGVQGASVAYHLRRLGMASVIVLDRGKPGFSGSSPRSAAMLVHQTMNPRTTVLAARSVPEYAEMQAEGRDIGYHQTGGILFAKTEGGAERLLSQANYQNEMDLPTEVLTPSALAARTRGLLKTDGIVAAIYCSKEGYLHPSKLVRAFLSEFEAEGSMYPNTEVAGLVRQDRQVVGVRLIDDHVIRSRIVVNAAGVHAREIAMSAGVDLPIVASERSLMIIDRDNFMPESHFLIEDLEDEWYFRPHSKGVLVGLGPTRQVAQTELVDEPAYREELTEELDQYLSRILPSAAGYKRVDAWSGYRPLVSMSLGAGPDDELPILGPVAKLDGYVDCCGAGAYGVTLASITGQLVARDVISILSSGESHLAEYSADRFPLGTSEI